MPGTRGGLADAIALYEEAIRAARAVGDSLGVAKSMLNTANVLRDYAQFERARTMFGDARDRLLAAGDSTSYARALNDLAALDILLGDPKRQSSDCRWPGDCSPRHWTRPAS